MESKDSSNEISYGCVAGQPARRASESATTTPTVNSSRMSGELIEQLSNGIPLGLLARRLGKHIATVYRWTQTGVGGRQLKTYKIGGQRIVLPSDLERFFAGEGEPADTQESVPAKPQTHKQALDKLKKQGLVQ